MSRFAFILVCSLIPSVLGAGGGGGGGHAVAESQVDVTDAANIKILNIDGVTTFNCSDAIGNKTRLVEWFKDGEHLETNDVVTVKDNGTLILNPTKEEHVGHYECRATTNEVLLMQEAIIFSYRKMPKSGTAIEGDKLTLTCEVEGVPRPIITWRKGNASLVEALGEDRVEFITSDEEDEKMPFNATVVVPVVAKDDRGNYTCTISSKGIVRETFTFVRVKDIYAALWPFLGIVVEVVVLCLIIFICEKRRTKNDFDESDTDTSPKASH